MEQKPYILVIEDNLDIAEIYAEILEFQGMWVEVILDGAVALQHLETAVPDVVLLDMHLPNISGMELLAFIRSQPHLKQSKVAVITGNPSMAEAARGIADVTFVKPASSTQVCMIVKKLLPRS